MPKRAKLGDVVEIQTKRGYGYAQFSSWHETYNVPIIRVLPGLFVRRPTDIASLVAGKELYHAMFLVTLAVHRGYVEDIGNYPIPKGAEAPAMWRSSLPDERGREVWSVGDSGYIYESLTDEQLSLPILSAWSFPSFVKRVESEWTPKNDKLSQQKKPK